MNQIMTDVQFQLHAQAMLSGPAMLFRPFWALALGGLAEGLIYGHLAYRAATSALRHEDMRAFRSSYTRLQRQLPFFSRRWVIEIVGRLHDRGAIQIVRTQRVNVIVLNEEFHFTVQATNQNQAAMLVFPELARKVGLLDAIALQQVHIRHHSNDGSVWVIRSFQQWHADLFAFLGMATVKRLFERLRKNGYVLVRGYSGENGLVNSYRVNYVRVAETLGIALPTVIDPKKKGWVNPLFPLQSK